MYRRSYRNPYWSRFSRKRRYRYARSGLSDRLTGGTKDVNPQYFNGSVALTTTDTAREVEFQLPVTRLPATNRVTITEILKIWVDFGIPQEDAGATEDWHSITVTFTTATQGNNLASFSDGNTIAKLKWSMVRAFTAAQGIAADSESVKSVDLTDGAGHGLLVATDKLYCQVSSALQTPDLAEVKFKIMYRFKTVGMREYVGIVQSQQ